MFKSSSEIDISSLNFETGIEIGRETGGTNTGTGGGIGEGLGGCIKGVSAGSSAKQLLQTGLPVSRSKHSKQNAFLHMEHFPTAPISE
jgi:hypothetical protein